jgi:protein-tyrosine phosphatase
MLREVDTSKIPGHLFLSSMPGRYAPFGQDNQEIIDHAIDTVISLSPLDEIWQKSPEFAKAITNNAISWERKDFPIEDYDIPVDREAFVDLARDTARDLKSGKRVVIHCGAGIGRTGTLAACVLLALGMEHQNALDAVAATGSRPETQEQHELVKWVAETT